MCHKEHAIKQKARARQTATGLDAESKSGFRFGFQNLATTVETGRADVMTQVDFAGGRFDGDAGDDQCVMGTVHAALGGRLLVLLDGHDWLLD